MVAQVSSDVQIPRITSTSFMIGTGLKKCRPTKRSGRAVEAPISVTVRLEVLEAKIVSGLQTAPRSLEDGLIHEARVELEYTIADQPDVKQSLACHVAVQRC